MKKKTKINIGAGSAAAVAVIAGVWYFLSQSNAQTENIAYVQKVSELSGLNTGTQRMAGVVETQDSLQIKKDSSKSVASIFVAEGQSVKNGDNLFQYDTTDAQNSIDSANLEIEGINNEIDQLKSDITDLQNQKNNASADEQYQYTSDISSKQLQITQNQYQIQSKQADIKKAQQTIDTSIVKASFDGVVSSLNSNGETASDGSESPFMVITQTGEYRIKGTIDEQSVGVITAGQSVIIRSRVDENNTWKGTVTQIETEPEKNTNNNYYSSDSSDNASSKYPFYVNLETSEGLMLGQHVFIEQDNGQSTAKEGIWLDSMYIITENDKNYVWGDDNGKLKKIEVTLGKTDDTDGTVEIVNGLTADTKIAWPDDTFYVGEKTNEFGKSAGA